jgi:hypothetical protein
MGCATVRGCGSGFGTSPGNIIPACECHAPVYTVRIVAATQDAGATYTTDPSAGMISAVNAFDITTLAWGTQNTITYEPGGSTTNSITSASWLWPQNYQYIAYGYPCSKVTYWSVLPSSSTFQPSSPVTTGAGSFVRCQVYIPEPTAYFVIAYGAYSTCVGEQNPDCISYCITNPFNCGRGLDTSQACIYPQQSDDAYPLIVDLGIPDQSLDSEVVVNNYGFGLINSSSSYPTSWCTGSGGQGYVDNGCSGISGFFQTMPGIAYVSAYPGSCGCAGAMYNTGQVCMSPSGDPFGAPWP